MKTINRQFISNLLRLISSGFILILSVTGASFASISNAFQGNGTAGEVSPEMLVGEAEAIEIADLWYAMELNRIGSQMNESELVERFNQMSSRQVFYLDSEKNLLDTSPTGDTVLAYIVKYMPTGYVVVSGSDRIEPIIAFSAESQFRWDQPEFNFLRHFLEIDIPNRWKYLEGMLTEGIEVGIHPHWVELRSILSSTQSLDSADFPAAMDAILLQWATASWDQGPFYNDVVTANNGNIAGIPTGCTATAMAIKMRFHEWPGAGSGSHAYTDTWGTVQFSHSVNFGNQTYTWANMPVINLAAANAAVADLMYHTGVAVDMDYEVGGSGAWPTIASMNNFFGYKATTELSSSHENPIRDSVLGGLPVIISTTAHTVLVDGYRDTLSPYYHVNAGWNGASDGWINFNQVPGSDPTIDRSYPYSSPSNYFYVDLSWSGSENGNLRNPYNTLNEGLLYTPSNGHLWLKAGSYPGAVSLTKTMTIHSYLGTSTLGE